VALPCIAEAIVSSSGLLLGGEGWMALHFMQSHEDKHSMQNFDIPEA
jgi:hypothetical protein